MGVEAKKYNRLTNLVLFQILNENSSVYFKSKIAKSKSIFTCSIQKKNCLIQGSFLVTDSLIHIVRVKDW